MTTYTTAAGSTIEIDGLTVTIIPISGAAPISFCLQPGVVILEDIKYCDAFGEEVYETPIRTGKYYHYAYRNPNNQPYVFNLEVANILNNAAAAAKPAAQAAAETATAAQTERRAIDAKRDKMVADIERGLRGREADAAADCYEIDMRRVESWYSRQIAAWEAKHAHEAAALAETARIAQVQAEIADLEDMAKGALIYDADGWLNADDQQARHDEYMAKTDALRSLAAVR